jgi:hypothetical protein
MALKGYLVDRSWIRRTSSVTVSLNDAKAVAILVTSIKQVLSKVTPPDMTPKIPACYAILKPPPGFHYLSYLTVTRS